MVPESSKPPESLKTHISYIENVILTFLAQATLAHASQRHRYLAHNLMQASKPHAGALVSIRSQNDFKSNLVP